MASDIPLTREVIPNLKPGDHVRFTDGEKGPILAGLEEYFRDHGLEKGRWYTLREPTAEEIAYCERRTILRWHPGSPVATSYSGSSPCLLLQETPSLISDEGRKSLVNAHWFIEYIPR